MNKKSVAFQRKPKPLLHLTASGVHRNQVAPKRLKLKAVPGVNGKSPALPKLNSLSAASPLAAGGETNPSGNPLQQRIGL